MRPGRHLRLPVSVYRALDVTDVVLHAGDIVTAELLHELGGFAPVYAVLGNNDVDPALSTLPETRVEMLDGVRLAMIHDSGPRAGRPGRLRRRFPEAAVVVFGHSHIPCNEPGVHGQLLFNPGSPTERRTQPEHTFGLLELDGGSVTRAEIVVA